MWSKVVLVGMVLAWLVAACGDDGATLVGQTTAGQGGVGASSGMHGAGKGGGGSANVSGAANVGGTVGAAGDASGGATPIINAGAGGEIEVAGHGGMSGAAQGGAGGHAAVGGGAGGQSAGGDGNGSLCDAPAPTLVPSCALGVPQEDPCRLCARSKCCAQWQTCYGTAPKGACGYGQGDDEGQLGCVLTCFFNNKAQEIDPDKLLQACSATCGQVCGLLSDATNDVVGCTYDKCNSECFPFN